MPGNKVETKALYWPLMKVHLLTYMELVPIFEEGTRAVKTHRTDKMLALASGLHEMPLRFLPPRK
jgi:hypothetical protein